MPALGSTVAPSGSGPLKTSGLAIGALIAGLLPCLFPFNLLAAVVMGILALRAIGERPTELRGRGLAIAGMALSGVGIVFMGIMAAIAIPSFIKYKSRAIESEGQVQLRALATAEQSYFIEHQGFMQVEAIPPEIPTKPTVAADRPELTTLGWSLYGPTRFRYRVEVVGSGPDSVATAHAEGKIDGKLVHLEERITADSVGAITGDR